MWEVGELDGLWMARVHRSKYFLLRKKSTTLPTEFVGESSGELVGVTLVLGPLFLLLKNEGDEDRMYMIWVVEGKSWDGNGAEKGGGASGPGWIVPREGLRECIIRLEGAG